MGIRDRLAALLSEAPAEAVAIEASGPHGLVWWTWGQVQRVAAAISEELDSAGVGSGGRVGLVVENRPQHVAALVAILAAGRCVVTFSPLQPPPRLVADIAGSGVAVVIGGPDQLAREGVRAAATANGTVIEIEIDGVVGAHGGAHGGADGHVVPGVAQRPGVAVEMLTSGTTGPPKRVHLSERQIDESLAAAGRLPREGRLLSRSASLVATPMVHIGGLWATLSTLYAGRTIVLLPRFEIEAWVGAVERHALPAAGLVPAAIRMVLDADVPADRLRSLRVVTAGTAPCPPQLAEEFFDRYGIRVLVIYGATEFAGAVAGWTLEMHEAWWDRKAGSAGRAFAGVELRVTGGNGTVLAPDEVGYLEICSKQAPGVGWIRTSDMARIDHDGFLWILGRADDVIVRGGFKVHPETVRKVLETHPGVREAAVAGLPDARLGAVPVAAIEVEPGVEPPEVEDLVALCRAHLSAYEVPRHVVIVDALPRTPSTKVSRVELLDLIQARLDARAAT